MRTCIGIGNKSAHALDTDARFSIKRSTYGEERRGGEGEGEGEGEGGGGRRERERALVNICALPVNFNERRRS